MKNKSVSENLFYNMLYQVVITVLPVLTTPYVARVLGLEANGIHSYTESIVTYFILFGTLGTSLYAVRKIAYVRENPIKLSKATVEILILKLFLMLVTLAVFIPALCIKSKYSLIYRLHIINVVANALDISWFYQGVEDFKKVTLRNLLVKLLFVVSLFIFIKKPSDLPLYVLLILGSTLIGNMLMFIYLPKYVNLKIYSPLKPFSHLKESFLLFIPQITNYVYALLDRSMLGWMTNTNNVGIYDQAQRLIRIITGVLQSLGYVMMAKISNLSSNSDIDSIKKYIRKSVNFTLFLAFPAFLGLIAVADDFIPFFLGKEYLEVIPTLKLLSVLLLTLSFNSILGVQILIPLKKEKMYTLATVSGAVTNVVINIIFIPRFGVTAACISSIVAEVAVFTISYIGARKIISIKNLIKDNIFIFIASVIMYFAVRLVTVFEFNILLKLIAEVFVGGAIYLLIAFVTKNQILFEIIAKAKNVLKRGAQP